ncbi:Gfo/Idh/MocA family protein [Kosmotoga sp. DU53]|uniref:Gfo/Idh/MocA family protein n=1 Tax=Kosmotoga sp. DU53 TaxID=1310160 RepID=UPI0007C5B4AA|nr:Gfo/Idh/MocA family oxidoreductase [Kosmotoga sp. DU53]OAA22632.1 hypothetical protein DU53_03735 [Kosmotoga sp. DU53]
MERIKVGISGLGRAGWNIHGSTLSKLKDMYEIVAIFDPLKERREEAFKKFHCRTYDDYSQFLKDKEVELVIIASPTHLHGEQTLKAFEQGKNVVCEKPMAENSVKAEELINLAKKYGLIYSVFHNRRYDPDYKKILQIINEKKIGEPFLIKSNYHLFSRRWDWQALKKFGGGELRNSGAHFLDQLLGFYHDEEPEIMFCDLKRTISLGDAEDHVKIILKGRSGLVCDLEISRGCAYPQERWLIMATRGGIWGTETLIKWKWVKEEDIVERRLEEGAAPGRLYNSEKIPWHEESWECPKNLPTTFEAYYIDFYNAYFNNELPPVSPESSARVLKLIEECERIASEGGKQE